MTHPRKFVFPKFAVAEKRTLSNLPIPRLVIGILASMIRANTQLHTQAFGNLEKLGQLVSQEEHRECFVAQSQEKLLNPARR